MVRSEDTVPAASVILVRSSEKSVEILLLKRNENLAYLGGAWVFPGGHVEEKDRKGDEAESSLSAATRAAVRETMEESGIQLTSSDILPVSLWITPEGLPKRFSTWFFLAESPQNPVCVDGSEIVDHRWMTAVQALSAHRTGEMFFAPPNFVILTELSRFRSVSEMIKYFSLAGSKQYRPRLITLSEGPCSLYEEDEEYDDYSLKPYGARHRLWMRDSGWIYEKNY